MQAFNQIEELWAGHNVDVRISADEMLKQAKKEVSGIKTRSVLNLIGMAVSFVAVGAVWLFLNFQSWTTHLGICIVLAAIAVYTVILYNNYRIIAKNNFTLNPAQFLQQLHYYQIKRLALYNRLYWFYTVALSLGMALYFVEILAQMDLWLRLTVVVVTFSWVILCSTLIRKSVIKREKERIALLVEKFERLAGQFINI